MRGEVRAKLTGSTLKIIAIIAMALNHVAYVFAAELPALAFVILLGVGGLTFPIMAYLIAEGYHHTSNLRRYFARLLVFAAISQLPYGLVLAPGATPLGAEGNVLFALVLELAVLAAIDRLAGKPIALVGVLAASLAASFFVNWGPYAVLFALVLSYLHDKRFGDLRADALTPIVLLIDTASVLFVAIAQPSALAFGSLLYSMVGAFGSTALLVSYNGARGLRLKWFFYVFYPAHIAVLGLVHLAFFA